MTHLEIPQRACKKGNDGTVWWDGVVGWCGGTVWWDGVVGRCGGTVWWDGLIHKASPAK